MLALLKAAVARSSPRHGTPLHVLVLHLKSKRPKYLQDAAGRMLEDRDDPTITARATLRSLLMRAATQAVAWDRGGRDAVLHQASDLATEPALTRDMACSHVHQGRPELPDQIWVTEEFGAASRLAIGDVQRVDVFNDHLHESRDRWRSDHGFVRAPLRLRSSP